MTVYALLPAAKIPFHTSAGNLANGYLLFVYNAGTTTKATTYTDSTGLSSNTNPIVLNSRGETPYGVYVASGQHKLVLAPSTDTDPPGAPIWSQDGITPENDISVAVATEWTDSGLTPTYVSAVSFTVPGNQTAEMHIGRRLKTINSGGSVYSTISNSVYGAQTTITVVNDLGTLDSGLSDVYYGFLAANNPSDPTNAGLTTATPDGGDYVSFLDSSAGINARALLSTILAPKSLATVATTSGTTVDLVASGMAAAGYSTVIILFDGVSVSGTDNILVQLANTAGFLTSGYVASTSLQTAAIAVTLSSAGFIIALGASGRALYGAITLHRQLFTSIPGGDTWTCSYTLAHAGATSQTSGGGNVSLGSSTPVYKLDGVRLKTTGADTFDAGSASLVARF